MADHKSVNTQISFEIIPDVRSDGSFEPSPHAEDRDATLNSHKPQNNLSFETGIEQLEQIVRELEQKDVPLDQALSLFRNGVELVQHCTKLLDHAEKQMEILLDNGDGTLRVEPARLALEG